MSQVPNRPTWKRLSQHRALVCDLVVLSERAAYYPVEQTFELGELALVRRSAPTRISWPVIFMKAYALVAARTPPLRQSFCRWPWPRLCECSDNVAMLAINRAMDDEERICFGRFISPEQQSLIELQASLDAYQQEPVEQIFRRQVRLSKCPAVVRRLVWWLNLNFAGKRRSRRLGTFGISTLAGQNTLNRFHPTVLTTSLTYGPLDAAGRSLVTLICDHRVIDGALAARVLSELDHTLRGPIADELRALSLRRVAA